MKIYEAWRMARDKQTIFRRVLPERPTFTKGLDTFKESFLIDASADDWELAKQKQTRVVTDAYFTKASDKYGGVDGHSKEILLTDEFLTGHYFTKITFEWEE